MVPRGRHSDASGRARAGHHGVGRDASSSRRWRRDGLARWLSRIRVHEHTHQATLGEIEQLQTQNAILEIIARSVDVTLAFQALASRVARLVPCDRMRPRAPERRRPGVPDLHGAGQRRRTAGPAAAGGRLQGGSDRARQRRALPRTAHHSRCRPRGGRLSRRQRAAQLGVRLGPDRPARLERSGRRNPQPRAARRHAYNTEHVATIMPIAEIFAVAVVAQQLQVALGKYRSMEAMSELTLSTAAEINSALQTIIGHCDLLERGYPDPSAPARPRHRRPPGAAHRGSAGEDAHRRERANEGSEVAAVASTQAGIPSSPEAFSDPTNPQV